MTQRYHLVSLRPNLCNAFWSYVTGKIQKGSQSTDAAKPRVPTHIQTRRNR